MSDKKVFCESEKKIRRSRSLAVQTSSRRQKNCTRRRMSAGFGNATKSDGDLMPKPAFVSRRSLLESSDPTRHVTGKRPMKRGWSASRSELPKKFLNSLFKRGRRDSVHDRLPDLFLLPPPSRSFASTGASTGCYDNKDLERCLQEIAHGKQTQDMTCAAQYVSEMIRENTLKLRRLPTQIIQHNVNNLNQNETASSLKIKLYSDKNDNNDYETSTPKRKNIPEADFCSKDCSDDERSNSTSSAIEDVDFFSEVDENINSSYLGLLDPPSHYRCPMCDANLEVDLGVGWAGAMEDGQPRRLGHWPLETNLFCPECCGERGMFGTRLQGQGQC